MKKVRCEDDRWFVDLESGESRQLSADQVSFLKASVHAAKASKQLTRDSVKEGQPVTFNADADDLLRRLRWDHERMARVSGELAELGLVVAAAPKVLS
jgi:hypothetical protein